MPEYIIPTMLNDVEVDIERKIDRVSAAQPMRDELENAYAALEDPTERQQQAYDDASALLDLICNVKSTDMNLLAVYVAAVYPHINTLREDPGSEVLKFVHEERQKTYDAFGAFGKPTDNQKASFIDQMKHYNAIEEAAQHRTPTMAELSLMWRGFESSIDKVVASMKGQRSQKPTRQRCSPTVVAVRAWLAQDSKIPGKTNNEYYADFTDKRLVPILDAAGIKAGKTSINLAR